MQPHDSFPPLDRLYLVELSRKGGRLVRRTVVCIRSFAMDVALLPYTKALDLPDPGDLPQSKTPLCCALADAL